ncbi:hypothetical protein [Gaiella sp.]|uniref:hypothetical protein n=1 Tax=Gaiella sp. TaxID=2663207 RepID=UPI003262E196
MEVGTFSRKVELNTVDDLPDGLREDDHRDYASRPRAVFRYGVLFALAVLAGLGLANAFGEKPARDRAESRVAGLEVTAPTRVRGGLFFQGRFRMEARTLIKHATLVLDPGWQEELSINTIEPSPIGEASRDGRLALDFGAIQPGHAVVAYVQFQVNPAQFLKRRSQGVALTDGEQPLLRIDRSLTVFP